jgi:hypothetical protein
MARQTELLNQLVQNQMGHFRQQSRGRDEPMSDDPLDADAWLRTIESKFALLPAPCSDENKMLFAAQQLRGTARLWWDHFQPCSLPIMSSPGTSSGLRFERTIYPKDSLSESSMNF